VCAATRGCIERRAGAPAFGLPGTGGVSWFVVCGHPHNVFLVHRRIPCWTFHCHSDVSVFCCLSLSLSFPEDGT
jgi:hypothetical protein